MAYCSPIRTQTLLNPTLSPGTAMSVVLQFRTIRNSTVAINAVRVKGRMSLRNGMWHGLRNDIIMRNLIYADHFQRNKLN